MGLEDQPRMSTSLSHWPVEWTEPMRVGRYGRRLGAVALVARRGPVAYRKTFGGADRERRLSMRDDTLFRIYSMMKPITCAATLMLCEEGHFLPESADARACRGRGLPFYFYGRKGTSHE